MCLQGRFLLSYLIRHPTMHVENKVITPFRDLIAIQCEYRAIDLLPQPKQTTVERGIEKNSERTVLYRPGWAERCRSRRLRGLSPVRSSQATSSGQNNGPEQCTCFMPMRKPLADVMFRPPHFDLLSPGPLQPQVNPLEVLHARPRPAVPIARESSLQAWPGRGMMLRK